MAFSATVRFGKMLIVGKARTERQDLKVRDKCVVRTDRGRELGELLTALESLPEGTPDGMCDILRRATPEDVKLASQLDKEHRVREMAFCKEEIAKLGLRMKLVEADHLFGGERIVFYFISESRVDFRELVRRLAHEFRTRIELKQIGARDQARLVGDIGHCGLSLCCRGWIKDLGGITMDMAKIQKHTADPSKITGRCGKLLCCLRYEYTWYMEGRDLLPTRGTRVDTRFGPGVVVDQNLLLREVTIENEGGERKIVKLGELAGAPKAAPGCTGCDTPQNAGLRDAEAGAATAPQAGLDTTVVRKLEQDTKILPAAVEPPDFRKAFAISDLPSGSGREIVLNGVAVAIFNVDGVFHAVQHECPHQGGPLAEGSLQGTVVTCSWHQWQFDVATGRGVSVSGSGIKRFEVKVDGGEVFVKV